MTYYLYTNKVIAAIRDAQWISYNQYENYNRQGITEMKKKLEESAEGEYGNVVGMMSLGVQCGIKGMSTRKPEL